jgi:hypothetical protein
MTPKIPRGNPYSHLYGVPHGILMVFNAIFYENEFQNPEHYYLLHQNAEVGNIIFFSFYIISISRPKK